MANEAGGPLNDAIYYVTHEVNDNQYRITVCESKTGKMCFSWGMPIPDAIEVAKVMVETLSGE